MKTKTLIPAVALGVVIGQVVTFLGAANNTRWDVMQLPCQCAWAVLAFPLGWLGFIAAAFAKFRWLLPYPDLLLWTGIIMNGIFWGWIVYRVVRSLRGQVGHHGFDASTFILPLGEVRRNHMSAVQARSRPGYAHKTLFAVASRAVRRCGYFFGRNPEVRAGAEEISMTMSPNESPQLAPGQRKGFFWTQAARRSCVLR
jgi:hypothetical protein